MPSGLALAALMIGAVGNKAARFFAGTRKGLDALGDAGHVVLPHVSMSLTQKVGGNTDGLTVLRDIIAGKYDAALAQFAAAVPLLGRPMFLRVGYEFNGHWNNYSAPEYVKAWRIIEQALAANATTRNSVALVWDMSCDAVAPADACTTTEQCWQQFWPGDDVVDWAGLNVFQTGRGKNFSSMPNSSCVLGFADAAAKRNFPVLIAKSFPRFHSTSAAGSWGAWFATFFGHLLPHPAVQGWSYINRDCRNHSGGGSRASCVGGLWDDAQIRPPAAAVVGALYTNAVANTTSFVHAGTLAATREALGVHDGACALKTDEAEAVDSQCNASLLQNVAFAGDNFKSLAAVSTAACARACCALPAACAAWTWVNRTAGGAACYLKHAAVKEACEPGETCVSWSRAAPGPPPPPPPPRCAPQACDRGWSKDAEGCCTALALGSALRPAGVVAYPHGANLNATAWEDRAYPWGGDAQLSDDGSVMHGFFAEFAGNCPMTYGTWYSSTHIRHAVAPADASGLPCGPFVAMDVAVSRAAGNPVLLKPKTADGFHVLFSTCQRFDKPVRNCTGRDPALWHKEAVYRTANDSLTMGVNLAYSRSLNGPWTTRRNILENVALPYGLQAETNPAAVLLPNGTVLLAYKTWPLPATCKKLIGSATCKAIGLVSSQHWNGSYTHRPMGEEFAAVGANLEDPSLYRDPKSGTLHMLMHTEASGGAGGSAHSTDSGKTWAFDYSKHAYDYTVTMSDGQQIKLTNREEPKMLLDFEGFPVALINQATVREFRGKDAPPPPDSPYKGPQSTHLTFTLMEPLLPALKTDEDVTFAAIGNALDWSTAAGVERVLTSATTASSADGNQSLWTTKSR